MRLIAAQDAPPTGPMVLCISGIIWVNDSGSEDGLPQDPKPRLELTDGWYRLQAELDEPLVRATRGGVLRVGRKIAMAGARVCILYICIYSRLKLTQLSNKLVNSGKDGMEILDAYDKCHLRLSGNSTHLAPWHTKLGFQREPFVAGLTSLTADGGVVAVADLVVVKVSWDNH